MLYRRQVSKVIAAQSKQYDPGRLKFRILFLKQKNFNTKLFANQTI